jgi:fructose 1,6-bisphosphatase
MEDLHQTMDALDTAYANFETVVDPDLIDCYTYEIYSVQKRYKVLLEQAKQMDIQTFT